MLRLTVNKRPAPKLSRVRVLVAVALLVNGIINNYSTRARWI